MKAKLLKIFQAALDASSGQRAVATELARNHHAKKFHVIAIGKAAESMLSGVPAPQVISALLISKHGHISPSSYANPAYHCIEADHPVPKSASLAAGDSLLKFLAELDAINHSDDSVGDIDNSDKPPLLVLISGGASALVEVLQTGWDLPQLQALTDYLLANAYPIHDINAIRRRISRIKGGGLWDYIRERDVTCLMISDVPDDDPAIIGSGLLFATENQPLPSLPQQWADKINAPQQYQHAPKDFYWKIIASLSTAKKAAAKEAHKRGLNPQVMPEFLAGEAKQGAKNCVAVMQSQVETLFIWGGETTVTLPKDPGTGGRNQHLALSAAIALQGDSPAYLLAAGTDGSDGMSPATGAIVDHQTIQRGQQHQLDAADYLSRADSHHFFKKTDEQIITGATGTNVMDLVLAIKLKQP